MIKLDKLFQGFFWIVIIILLIKVNGIFKVTAVIDVIYYIILTVSFLISLKFFKNIIASFPTLFYLILFHVIYFLLIEVNINGFNLDGITYFVARIFLFIFICSCIYFNPKFIQNGFLGQFSKLALLLTIIGFASMNFQNSKFYGLFNNPNVTGSVCAIGFLFWQVSNKKLDKKIWLIGNLILISGILATQSRGALIGVMVLFAYHMFKSIKSFLIIVLTICFCLLAFADQIEKLPGISRILAQDDVLEGRHLESDYAIFKIQQKPFTGWGMADNKNDLSSKIFNIDFESAFGAHNSYLFFIQIFGIFFGVIIICILLIPFINTVYKILINKAKVDHNMTIFLLSFGYIVCHSFFESFMIGIGHIIGFIFFLSYFYFSKKTITQIS